ncbi:MAG: hypothetical protein LUB61_00655 [Eggerthellaceae bacterium]|nr:hypothetical protein [Eggerthellaceae bacterium]
METAEENTNLSVKVLAAGSSLPGIPDSTPVLMILEPGDIEFISEDGSNAREVRLPLVKIINIEQLTRNQLEEKSKHPIGRAIIGDLIFGPIGAIVGAASGIGTYEEMDQIHYIEFDYTHADGTKCVIVQTYYETVDDDLNNFLVVLRDRCPNLKHEDTSVTL